MRPGVHVSKRGREGSYSRAFELWGNKLEGGKGCLLARVGLGGLGFFKRPGRLLVERELR